MMYSIVRSVVILLFKIIFRIKVFGKKNIPKKGGFILVSNHASYLDPVTLGVACPRKLNFMARHDLFDIPIFSKLLTTLGAFPIKRNTADLSALKEALKRLKNGEVVVLFPEGSRRFDGISDEPQPGIGFLSTKADVPVIPSFIKGTDLALPKGAKMIRPKKICVYFGQEIHIERRQPNNYQDIAMQIMHCVRHLTCT